MLSVVGARHARVTSPSVAAMDQVVEAQPQPDAASVVSVTSSAEAEESGLILDLWRRVSRMGRRTPQGQVVHVPEGSSPIGNIQGC